MKKNRVISLIFMAVFSTNVAFASVLPTVSSSQSAKNTLLDRVLVTATFKTPPGGIRAVGDLYVSSDSSCHVHAIGPECDTHVKSSHEPVTSKGLISLEKQLQGTIGHWGCLQVTYKYNNGLYKSPKVLLTWDGKAYISATPSAFSIDFTKAPVK